MSLSLCWAAPDLFHALISMHACMHLSSPCTAQLITAMLLFNFQTSFCLQRDTVVVAYYILICLRRLVPLGMLLMMQQAHIH